VAMIPATALPRPLNDDLVGRLPHSAGDLVVSRAEGRVALVDQVGGTTDQPQDDRLALAWELQAKAFGGLSRETSRKLDQLAAAKTKTSPVTPGMRLVREWNGKAHVVTIGEDR
jgi:hypothetical protein